MTDFIETYPAALDPGTCRSLIDMFEASGAAARNTVVDGAGGLVENEIRKSDGLVLTKEMCGEHYDRLNAAFQGAYGKYREKYEILQGISQVEREGYALVRYRDDTEHYGWHSDGTGVGLRYRFLSAICYLNTVEDGGETEFRLQDRKVAPQEGMVVLFPSTWTHEHRGLPPRSGSKYIITTWLRFIDKPNL